MDVEIWWMIDFLGLDNCWLETRQVWKIMWPPDWEVKHWKSGVDSWIFVGFWCWRKSEGDWNGLKQVKSPIGQKETWFPDTHVEDHSIWWSWSVFLEFVKLISLKGWESLYYIYIYITYSRLLHWWDRKSRWSLKASAKIAQKDTKVSIQSRIQKWKGITSKMTVWWRPNWAQPRSRKEPVRSAMFKAI